MTEENINQEFRFKNKDETENYFLKEIKINKLISNKHEKVFNFLNYAKNLVTLRQKYLYVEFFLAFGPNTERYSVSFQIQS